jgi:hypothetical protein
LGALEAELGETVCQEARRLRGRRRGRGTGVRVGRGERVGAGWGRATGRRLVE